MAKTENKMFNFDPTQFMGGFDASKMMADFDPTKMSGEFTKLMGDFKVPSLDIQPIMEMQRKNIEAVVAANKLAVEGIQAVFKRQGEILQKTLEEVNSTVTNVTSAGNVQDSVIKQTEVLQTALDSALGNMRELAEMVSKSNTEAFETVNKRFSENLEEIKAEVSKLKA
ncbi:MAG: phasin family protein [Alphaproteobacteria bacterium]|nr:phasin family protein [Rhodospirillales bacterium]MCW9046090.1 phasin family protein [Alphaproteobacteria bacterium]